MIPALVVGGAWIASIATWGQLNWSTNIDGGSDQATWAMDLPLTFAHPKLTSGQLVQIKAGAANLFSGILAEPSISDQGWAFTADGLSKRGGGNGAGFMCLDGSGNTSTTPNTVIDAAIARGLPWSRPNSISSAAFTATDTTIALNYISDLLDAYAKSVSKHWGVDENGVVYLSSEPTTPTWQLVPGSGRFGLADSGYASTVFVRYWNGTKFVTASATDTVAAARYGPQEYPEDATNAGTLTSTKAAGLAAGALARGKARLGWTNPLSPTRWQLTTTGGTPAPLWMVKAGQMVRLHGVINEQGQPLPYVDFVIGQTSYDAANDALTISPVGMVARDLASVLSEGFAA